MNDWLLVVSKKGRTANHILLLVWVRQELSGDDGDSDCTGLGVKM